MEEKYKKIINLTHHASPTRKKMEIKDRAAQFAPYAALTGFEDVVNETSRITERRIIPDNQVIERLNRTIVYLLLNSDKAEAKFTFFIEDERGCLCPNSLQAAAPILRLIQAAIQFLSQIADDSTISSGNCAVT